MRRRSVGLLARCLIGALFLTGCIRTHVPARPLLVTPDGNAAETAVAVQADGTKHYVWTECTTADGSCQLVYYRTKIGAPNAHYVFTPEAGTTTKYPDVAVTMSGHAFVVRSVCKGMVCTDYYSIIPATFDGAAAIASYPLAEPGASSAGAPRLEARGNVVYATYQTAGDTHARLRYRQLSGGSSSGFVDVRADVRPSNVSIDIDYNGKLHAVWLAEVAGSHEVAYGTNVGTTGDFAPSVSHEAGSDYHFKHPDIALDSANRPYIVYAFDDATTDTIKLRCEAPVSSCFGGIATRVIPLDPGQGPWRLRGNPQLTIRAAIPNVVFSAKNGATGNHEIWHYSTPVSETDQALERVTINDVEDDAPIIAEENSNFGEIVVAGWNTYYTIANPIPGGSSIECSEGIYMFYFNKLTLRRIDGGNGGCFPQSPDLAANEQWVAGVWLDTTDEGPAPRLVPWTTFNAYVSYLPLVSK